MCRQQTTYDRRDGVMKTAGIGQCESFYNRQKKTRFSLLFLVTKVYKKEGGHLLSPQ